MTAAVKISPLDQAARDLATSALAKAEAHELLCTERWRVQAEAVARIERTMDAVNLAIHDKIGRLPASIIAALSGLCGYLAARAFPIH